MKTSIRLTFACILNILFFTITASAQTYPALDDKKLNQITQQATGLDKVVLKRAVDAFEVAHTKGLAKNHFLTIIDYSKPSKEKRFWVIDMNTGKVKYETHVAHGKNSGYATSNKFSNTPNSKASSIGVFLTKSPYIGRNGYSLRMEGLEKGFNDNAMKRAIVIHGSTYVSEAVAKSQGRVGLSWGCPALPKNLSKEIIDTIKNDAVVFSYYPQKTWLAQSNFVRV